jgi:hypothetical protein
MTNSKAISVLSKRKAWLGMRIASSTKDLSYDRAEYQALEIALTALQEIEERARMKNNFQSSDIPI